MKLSYRFIAIIICITVMAGGSAFAAADLTGTADTAENTKIELYSMAFQNEMCTVIGRVITKNACTVNLTAEKQNNPSASPTELSQTSEIDGGFFFSFALDADVTGITIEAEEEILSFALDAEGIMNILSLGAEDGYTISSVEFDSEAITLSGTQGGAAGGRLTLKVYGASDTSDGGMNTTVVAEQFKSEADGSFCTKFMIPEGEYIMEMKSEGLEKVTCTFNMSDCIKNFVPGEDDAVTLIRKLNIYAGWIEEKIEECEAVGIPTDYERANLSILKKFIEYIEDEASAGESSRWEQYNKALCEISVNTISDLEKYLSGEKTAFAVPHYVVGDITTDGTKHTATVEIDGVQEQRPVFFTGYGHFDTAIESMTFFSEIGVNVIQIGVMLKDLIAPYDPNIIADWDWVQGDTCEVSAERISAEKNNGSYSLKINNTNGVGSSTYGYLHQKVKVEPNTTYVYGGNFKGSNLSGVWLNLGAYNDKEKGLITVNPSSAWTNHSGTYTTEADETELDFTISFNNYITDLYLDDFYFKKEGTAVNILKNPGFETAPGAETALEKEAKDVGFYIRRQVVENFGKVLKKAEENNIMTDICIGMDTTPQFIYKLDENIGKAGTKFQPFAMDNETIRKVNSIYAKALLAEASKYKSVYTVCVANEPEVNANGSDVDGDPTTYYDASWHAYLENKYKTIETLNEKYGGTSYEDFTDVDMPEENTKTPLSYDYVQFNTSILTDYLTWLVTDLRSAYPQFKYHAKTMMYFRSFGQGMLFHHGSDIEKIQGLTDLSGTDGNINYGASTPFSSLMSWYDYMTSVSGNPVWDTELHILSDKSDSIVDYQNGMPDYIAASTWNGAVHGRGGLVQWMWDLNEFAEYYPNTNMAYRPAEAAANARAMMDLHRLSEEVTAVQQAEPNVGILYSRTGLLYHDNTEVHTKAYEDIIFSGQKVGYVTDSDPSAVNKYELLIVPETQNVKADMLNNIKSYIENGGEILLVGDNCLKYDEYGDEHNADIINYIYSHADTTSSVKDKISEMGLSEIILVDSETGASLDNVEWAYAPYGDGYVINVLNYDASDIKNIAVEYNGERIGSIRELRGNTSDADFSLEPMKPALLAFNTSEFDLIDDSGEVLEENLDNIKSGIIKYQSNEAVDGNIIMALYKDGELIKFQQNDDTIEVSLKEAGSYRLMASVWEFETMKPLTKSRSITVEVE